MSAPGVAGGARPSSVPVDRLSYTSVLDRFAEHARSRAPAPAVVEVTPAGPGRSLSWHDLRSASDAVAAWVRAARGAEGGSGVVLLSCPNRAEFIAAFLGVLEAGAVVMPLHPKLAPAELRRAAEATGAMAAIAAPDAAAHLAPLGLPTLPIDAVLARALPTPTPAPRAVASTAGPSLLLQTSGTTGTPNIAVRSGASLAAVAGNVAHALGLTQADTVLACIPLCHSYGVENGLLGPIYAGACIRLCEGFDAPVVHRELLETATVFPGVPFMFEALSVLAGGAGATPPSGRLRIAYSAGTTLPLPVAAEFRRRFGLDVAQLYGATEVGSVTFNDPRAPGSDPSSVGLPMPGVRIAILDPADPDPATPLPADAEGHVAISAPSMLSRYLDGHTPIVSGFFLTGDLGRLDPRGRLTITGRLKLQIDVGGLKVNPTEVESVLARHPGVAECAVVGQALGHTVTRVRAVVVPRQHGWSNPASAPDAAELRRFAQAHLAPFKVPRIIEFRDSLPKSPMGKVLRRELESA